MTFRPEEFNAANFPSSPKKKFKKNFARGLMLVSTTSWIPKRCTSVTWAPSWSSLLCPYVSVIYPTTTTKKPLTAQRSLVAGFLKISSIPWQDHPHVARHNGAAVRQRRLRSRTEKDSFTRTRWRACLCPYCSPFSFPTVFQPSPPLSPSPRRLLCAFPAALIGG